MADQTMFGVAGGGGSPSGNPLRRAFQLGRRPVQALADQAVSSLTNFVTALIAARMTTPAHFGAIALALTIAYMSLIIGRALVGEPMLARVAHRGGYAVETTAMRTAALIGVIAAVLVALASLIPWPPLAACWLVAPWLPSLVVQDTARYAAFARQRPDIALASDLSWAVIQATVITTALLLGSHDVLWVISAWGAGATAGAILGCWRLRLSLAGSSRTWLAHTRRYSGWLAPQLIIGQLTTLAVNLIVAVFFGTSAVGALRAMVTLSMPIFVVLTAAQALVVPGLVAALDQLGTQEFLRLVRRWSTVITIGGTVVAVGCILLSRPLTLVLFGHRYLAYSSFVVPFAVGAALHAAALLPSSGLRAMRDARSLFLVQIVVTPLLIIAVLLASTLLTPYATAWAMTSQGLTTAAFSWFAFSRRLRTVRAQQAVGSEQSAAPVPARASAR